MERLNHEDMALRPMGDVSRAFGYLALEISCSNGGCDVGFPALRLALGSAFN